MLRLSGLALLILLAGCGGGGVPANGGFGAQPTKAPTETQTVAGARTETPQTPTATATVGGSYTVAAGDTLWDIAQRFGTTVEALVAANGLSNADEIVVGQVLTLAAPASTTPAPATATPTPTP